ncbi:MAG TPA: hypothetical protein VLK35_00665 [Methylomirabilota bacterium]|nr:hypothetical protein [Methylomirabilota bacterium]
MLRRSLQGHQQVEQRLAIAPRGGLLAIIALALVALLTLSD